MEGAVLELPTSPDLTAASLLEAGPASPRQTAAWERFAQLPWPSRSEQAWRFANLKRLDLARYSIPQPVGEAAAEDLRSRSAGLTEVAGRLVFANDQLLQQNIAPGRPLPSGVLWLPLEQAAVLYPELLERYFMREEAILGGQKFAALHAARVRTGTFLYVPKGVELELPLETFHWLHGSGSSCFPHTLIVAEEQSKVTLVEHFRSGDESAAGFACGVNDLWLGAGAQVTYVCVQDWNAHTLAFQMNATVVGRDASATALNLHLGGSYARSESVSYLRGAGGRSLMLAVTNAQDTQEFDQRTFQVHAAPNTASDLLYKNSLDDEARTIFSGLIRVDPGAHRTDAYQKVRNLLLSDESEANSAPGLEIEADDVRCTHGATSGQVDAEELFYLLSRGIPQKAAQKLIVFGFLNEVLDRVPDAAVQEHLRAVLRRKFATRAGASQAFPS